jgi:dihydroorotate dehydrogenase
MDYRLFRKFFFSFDPEKTHDMILRMMQEKSFRFLASRLFGSMEYFDERLKQKLFNEEFSNPVGLAAGFDKNAEVADIIDSFGFGYAEVGTVTKLPQDGNEKPRLFRFADAKSLQNSMGFNNLGSDYIASNLSKSDISIPIGISIGKSKDTDPSKAIDDYVYLIRRLEKYAAYLQVNVSSPNTKGLRDLENPDFVQGLFEAARTITKKPMLLKIDPDIDAKNALEVCSTAIDNGANGIIATNTSKDYSLLKHSKDFGGISGRAIAKKSMAMLKVLADEFFGQTILVSVGGIDSADEAYERILNGASLLQIYTSFIFEGPTIARRINEGIARRLEKDGYENIADAVGAGI